MSEYRKKIDGFVWPTALPDSIRYLARWKQCAVGYNGIWMGYDVEPVYCNIGYWHYPGSEHRDGLYVVFETLPAGTTPLLLCRDDYMSPTKRSVTFHGVSSGDGESFLWGEVPHDAVLAICGEFANPGQDHLSPVEILYHLGAMDGKRRKITITVEDVA